MTIREFEFIAPKGEQWCYYHKHSVACSFVCLLVLVFKIFFIIIFLLHDTETFSDTLEDAGSFTQDKFSELVFILFQYEVKDQGYSEEILCPKSFLLKKTDDFQMIFSQLRDVQLFFIHDCVIKIDLEKYLSFSFGNVL